MMPLQITAVLGAVGTALGALAAASPALAGGGCVGKVLLPPVEAQGHERVLVAPGHEARVYIPGRVERSGRRVLVRAAREERMAWGAIYHTERRVVYAPGPTHWVRQPDRYEDVAEHVMITPGHVVWERRYAPVVSGPPQPGQTVVTPTGVVMCRVWCPARYEIVMHRVRVGKGRMIGLRSRVAHVQASRVLVRPAASAMRRIPAEYRWVSTSRAVEPGRWAYSRTPARYAWRTTTRAYDGGEGYAPVVCGGPLSRPAMARMQMSLAGQGYDPGPQDGIGRPETYAALRRFQVDHRLAAGQVTVESARALQVIP